MINTSFRYPRPLETHNPPRSARLPPPARHAGPMPPRGPRTPAATARRGRHRPSS